MTGVQTCALPIYTIENNDLYEARKAYSSNTVTPNESKKDDYGVVFFEITDVPAAEIDELQSFTFGGHTYRYSVLDYVAAVLNAGDLATPEETALAIATYWYNQAANTYFG